MPPFWQISDIVTILSFNVLPKHKQSVSPRDKYWILWLFCDCPKVVTRSDTYCSRFVLNRIPEISSSWVFFILRPMLHFPPILADRRNWMHSFHGPSRMWFLIFCFHSRFRTNQTKYLWLWSQIGMVWNNLPWYFWSMMNDLTQIWCKGWG